MSNFMPKPDARGRVRIFDLTDNTWRDVFPIDAREMVRAGTASFEAPRSELTLEDAEAQADAAEAEAAKLTERAAELRADADAKKAAKAAAEKSEHEQAGKAKADAAKADADAKKAAKAAKS